MKKLIRGVVDFRQNLLPERRELLARLAAVGQSPDTLFITCSDSRVAPNWFASTDPGDLFVVRNVGNLVPPCTESGEAGHDHSVAAALEFAVESLKASHIVVCGHSECGAMLALTGGASKVTSPNLRQWLSYGEPSLTYNPDKLEIDPKLSAHNALSQINVLMQLRHLETYPAVKRRIEDKLLQLHGWWFDIAQAGVYAYEPSFRKFTLIDEAEGKLLLEHIEKRQN